MDVDLVSSSNKGKNVKKSSVNKIVEKEVLRAVKRIVPRANIKVFVESENRVNIYLDEKFIPKIIGKKGKKIANLERKVGINIGVEPIESLNIEDTRENNKFSKEFEIPYEISRNHLSLNFGYEYTGSEFDVLTNDEYLFTATVGKKGIIRLKKDLELVDILFDAITRNIPIIARLRSND
jgi:ATPase